MSIKIKNWFLVLAVFVLFCYGLSLTIGGREDNKLLADLVYLIAPLSAFIIGVFAVKAYGIGNMQGKSMFFLTLSMLLLFIGEGFWFHLQYIQNVEPDYSLADVFFLLSYPLSFVGIFIKLKASDIHLKDLISMLKKKNSIFFIPTLAVAFVAVSYFGIFKVYDPEVGALENVVFMFYGFGDLVIILGCLLVMFIVMEFKGGKLSFAWLLLVLSYFSTLLGDIFYAIYRNSMYEENLVSKVVLDVFWMLGYFVFAAAMLFFVLIVREKQKEIIEKLENI